MEFVPRLRTRSGCCPTCPATAMVQCDLVWLDHAPVAPVAAHDPQDASSTGPPSAGCVALAGTELEFIAFDDDLRGRLRPRLPRPDAGQPVQRRLLDPRHHAGSSRCCATSATTMYAAGLDVEGAKGECNFGQHEIGFLYADALVTADNHAVYKTVAKEIAAQHGKAITFMAKYDEREGNSCHIHLSLRGDDGDGRLLGRTASARRSTTSSSPACSPRCADFTLLYAPNINSYKRFAAGSFAPTAIAWGLDNRTCAVRLVGHGARRADGEPAARRRREPLPRAGRDARRRPARHRARAGARGRAGRQRLRPPTSRTVPHTLRAARDAFAALGDRPRRPSATRSSTTTRTWPTSSSPPSTPPSPTGSCAAASRGCERDDARTPSSTRPPSRPVTEVPLGRPSRRPTPRSSARTTAFPAWRDVAPGRAGPAAAPRSPPSSTRTSRSSPSSRSRNAGHTSGNARWEAGNVRDCLNYYSAAPGAAVRPADPGRRAASTSPSTSRSAWSA